jgi:hypothetical protein
MFWKNIYTFSKDCRSTEIHLNLCSFFLFFLYSVNGYYVSLFFLSSDSETHVILFHSQFFGLHVIAEEVIEIVHYFYFSFLTPIGFFHQQTSFFNILYY